MSIVFQTVCILVAFVLSCHAKNCCFPDQFESTVTQVIGSVRYGLSKATFSLSFDTLGKRIYIEEYFFVDKKKYGMAQLQLYNEGVQYNILNNKTCAKVSLKPWKNKNCIPDDAIKLPPTTLGMKPNLKIQDYYWIADGVIYTMTVTSDTCVPVFDQYENFPGVCTTMLNVECKGTQTYRTKSLQHCQGKGQVLTDLSYSRSPKVNQQEHDGRNKKNEPICPVMES